MRIRRPKLAVIAAILVLPAASALGQARDEKQGMPVGVPIKMEKMDVSPALRNIQPIPPQRALNAPENPKVKVIKSPVEGFLAGADQAVQSSPGTREMPATTVNFEGVGNVNGVLPPDTQGDIGPNHYVQWVNLSFAIYNRAGTVVFGPAAGNTIWSGFGGACQSENAGDPITLYDPLSQRWVMSQFTSGSAPYKLCVAVSTTNDPTGTWNRYAFDWPANKFPDYPKWGVWPNSYFVTVNQFVGNSWGGAGVAAFEKDKMVLGQPARAVYYDLLSANSNFGGMLPADLDGASPPPAAAPGVFVEVDDSSYLPPNDAIRIWYFTVDWSVSPTPTSSFGLSGQPNETLTVSNFNLMPCTIAQTRTCIDQPTATTTQKLDAIGDRAMYRAAYRNFSGDQRLVFNHTVDAGSGRAGVRWYELQKTGATWAVRQQGTYAPADTLHRWMGSISQDGQGNIALGYSTSGAGAGQFPSIAITGKLGADPADGSMTQAESVIMAGTGAQTHSAARWGDYSMMGIDPADDCTFWYTTEYVQTTGSAPWQTRVAAFKYPGCAASTGTITGTVKNAATNAAIVGASVTIPGGFSTFTDGTGTYSIVVPSSATYNVTATAAGYSSATLSSGNVGAGATVTVNFLLNGVAVIGSTTFTQTAESCIPANSTPDPGETVTYSLCLANTGNANTANLVVNLQAGGGVVAGSSQNYGVVTAAGPAVCRDFTFQVSPGVLCTAAVTATFTLADGATTFPNVVRTLTTGAQAVTGAESFDTVTAPALPPGWTTTASGPGAAGWVTSTNAGGFTSNTSPNFAFIDDPAGVSDKSIYSPVINLPAGSNTLSFYHRYAFETPAYDGGVLEIAIGSANVLSNTYQDIVAAGGVFTLNGYSGTISSSFGNPLGGRQAFIGTTSGLYRNTTLTMPPAAGGQPIKLRWRMGSDSTTASTGWAIDTITLPGLPAGPITCACAVPILGATTFTQQTGESCTAPSNGVPDPGETVTYSLCIQNTGGAGTTNLVATLQAGGGVVAGSSQNYGAVAAAATVCRDFTFQVSNALTCGQQVTATFTLADGAATYPNIVRTLNTGVTSQSGPTAFANTTPITIPGAVAGGIQSANPFPSSIVVSGLTGMVSKVTVSLNGYAHAWSADVDMLLVGPAGQKVIIMSDAGPSGNQASVSFTLDDAAAGAIPSGSITNGASYKPTNSGAGDTFNTAPPGPYGAALSDFIGTNPNGTWSLYIVDDFGSLDNGSLATGWAINITTSVTTCCVTVTNQAPTVTPTPGGITVPRGATTNLQIATVTDTDTAPPTLVFSVPSATAGLLLSNFVLSPTVANTWAVTADVFASCTALPTGETATLQAYDGTNTVQATLNVNTTANAAGATLTGGATLCAGESTTLSVALTGVGPWSLTWSDGFVQSGIAASPATRVVSPAVTTTYTITAVSGANGCAGTGTGSALVTVNPRPTGTVSGGGTICAGTSSVVSVALTGTAPWTITWNDGMVQIAGASPATRTVSPTFNQAFSVVSLSDSKCAGGTSTGIAAFVVKPVPSAVITAADGVCFSSTGNVASVPDGGAGTTYAWAITGGTITAGTGTNSVTFTANASGNVVLTVTVTKDGCPNVGTKTIPIQTLPSAPVPMIPSNGSTYSGAFVSWTHAGGTYYDVYLDTVNPPEKLIFSGQTNNFEAFIPSWVSGVTYYWKVVARNGCGSVPSSVQSFVAGSCPWTGAAPVLTSPANGATGVGSTATLVWTPVAGTAHYDVYLGTSSGSLTRYDVVEAPQNSVAVPVSAGATYYWKVVAVPVCGSAAVATSSTNSFTTAGTPFGATGFAPSFFNRWETGTVTLSGSGFTAGMQLFTDYQDAEAGTLVPAIFTNSFSNPTQLQATLIGNPAAPAGRYDVGVTVSGLEEGRLLQAMALRAFTDVTESDYYYLSSARMADAGIMEADFSSGTPGPQYMPNTNVPRALMAEYLAKSYQFWRYRSTGLPSATCTPSGAGSTDFPDVACSHPNWLAIHWIKAWGVTQGSPCAEGLCFNPNNNVTRAEMVTFIERLRQTGVLNTLLSTVGETDPGCAVAYPACKGWTDAGGVMDVAGWPRREANVAFVDRITAGCSGAPGSNLKFCPNDAVTRAQIGEFLARTLGLVPMP